MKSFERPFGVYVGGMKGVCEVIPNVAEGRLGTGLHSHETWSLMVDKDCQVPLCYHE